MSITKGWMRMQRDPLPVAIGGLFRCCIATYDELAPDRSVTKEGDTLRCSHCHDRMIVVNGAWVWDEGWALGER